MLLILLLILLAAAAPLSACQFEEIEPLEFVRKIGEENEKSEFMIVKPRHVTVDASGRIYVDDEGYIKVFDMEGNGLSLIGGPGQGPGEFQFGIYGSNFISPTGYITAMDRLYFNLYDPDYNFLKRIYYIPMNGRAQSMRLPSSLPMVVCLNEDEYYMSNYRHFYEDDRWIAHIRLYYVNGADTVHIAEYDELDRVTIGMSSMTVGLYGRLIWGALPDGSVLYTHTRGDERISDGRGTLILHRWANGDRSEIEFSYDPLRVTEERYESLKNSGSGSNVSRDIIQQIKKKKEDLLRKQRYETAFGWMYIDGWTLFLPTRERYQPGECSVVVFDLKSGQRKKYLFPFPLSRSAIRNGYLCEYRTGNANELPGVNIYRIKPEVYVFDR